MNVVPMTFVTARLFDEIERKKVELLRYTDTLSAARLAQRPGKGEWSPLEVIEHLLIVEEMIAQADRVSPGTVRVSVKSRIFMALAVGPMRPAFRMPTMPVLQPKVTGDYASLKARWSQARSRIAEIVRQAEGRPRDEAQILHPMAGAMSAEQAIDFLNVHLRYHAKHFPK